MAGRKWIVALLGLAGLVIALTAAVFELRMALDGAILDNTRYAEGYSRQAFEAVKPGMTKPQVRALLGLPLERRTSQDSDEELWYYTLSGTFGWRQKIVWFNSQGVVDDTIQKWDEPEVYAMPLLLLTSVVFCVAAAYAVALAYLLFRQRRR